MTKDNGIDPEALAKVNADMKKSGDSEEAIHHFEVDGDKFEAKAPDGNRAFISVWDNALEDEWCEKLIDMFEVKSELHRKTEHPEFRSFTELNFFDPKLGPEYEEACMHLLGKVSEYTESYRRHNQISFFPQQCHNEEVRMKKYFKGSGDDFKYHADVGDYASARRFLVCFFYLNDVEEGGETVFPDYETSVEARKGRLAIFPPFWTHPHAGQPAISNDKYIIGTYLHYI